MQLTIAARANTCPATVSPSAVSFTLQTVPEHFFIQGDVAIPDPGHYAQHLGLHLHKTWTQVNEYMRDHTNDSKLIILLRHGEGIHNADKARVGEKAWEEEYQFLPKYLDAPLTQVGIHQAEEAGVALKQELHEHGLELDLVVVSPLDRTLDTYKTAFQHTNLSAPVVAMELSRETLGICPCDRRKPLELKRKEFPHIDFSSITSDEDSLWSPTHRETDDEIEERARKFLHTIFYERSERRIVVVSHNGFSRACLRVLGHRYYRPYNAEFIPLLVHDTAKPIISIPAGSCNLLNNSRLPLSSM